MIRRRMTNIVKSTADAETVLLLHFEDSLKDSSKNNITVNASKTPTYSEGKFNRSIYFDGSLGLTFLRSLFSMNGNFTVDFWHKGTYLQTYEGSIIMDCCNGSAATGTRIRASTSDCGFIASDNGKSWNQQYPFTPTFYTDNTFHHYALVRNGNNMYYFIDGVLKYSYSNVPTNLVELGSLWYIGRKNDGRTNYLRAYISEFRISNIARWTSSFTPPTKAY